ncbi:Hypothetical predicted protein [Olea europaea subsp. europaea]|uniref:Uncharacterized protein n=1 Tax=Olea europaea subsp. europaea TaxID=158383 RepID=A0A8S0QW00_OLEEU|nr:Hypothetical predicted protein [Olea europaea subsp. europaea]
MSNAPPVEAKCRPVGGTELSWCKAVPGGTGITVLGLLLSKPLDITILRNALHKLQISHPILNSQLHLSPTSNSYSYVTPPTPQLQIRPFDLQSTSQILQTIDNGNPTPSSISPFHLIMEHELNKNAWQNQEPLLDIDLFFASVYTLENENWVVALRLHTSACDRTSALALLRELLGLIGGEGFDSSESGKEMEVNLGIEDDIPSGKANKPLWARGVDMLGYSLNSLRLANLSFKDTEAPRMSRVVRLQLNSEDTDRILSGCNSREIKLCGLLASAAILATHSSKGLLHDQWEKYAVVTLTDCRSNLDPVLSKHHMGFYHSAILNTHDVGGGENLWELAKRTYNSFANAKNNKKHFSDMADINFLMCKAIENPGLTPSGSLRTSLISVFEDVVINHSNKEHQGIGIEDFMGCASVHGVGPSLAIFDTIRDGELDCACVYPSPLHSRQQMHEFVDEMKRILLNGSDYICTDN